MLDDHNKQKVRNASAVVVEKNRKIGGNQFDVYVTFLSSMSCETTNVVK